ncbi:hypothetical protein ACEQ8H_001669 [Pleosporales sp. CAS-2024a]
MNTDGADDESDFDLGSDAESESCFEDDMEVTSRASVSSSDDVCDNTSDSTSPGSGTTITRDRDAAMNMNASVESQFSEPNKSSAALEGTGSQPMSLVYLGKVVQASIDQDWALIDLTYQKLALLLGGAVSGKRRAQDDVPGPTSVFVHNHDESRYVPGELQSSTTLLRLPGISMFREFFQVDLDSAVKWGGCGALVLDAATYNPYGHVVATSANRRIAFVSPTRDIFTGEAAGFIVPLDYNLNLSLDHDILLHGM